MTITFDITRCAAVTADNQVCVRASNISADSNEMDFVGKLVSEVEKFAHNYINPKEESK